MLTDITLGQYFPGNSYLHRLDPRMKIMVTMIFIFSVFKPEYFAASSFPPVASA